MTTRARLRGRQLLTEAAYHELLATQDGGCAVCHVPPKTRRLDVDHDHKTGRVRGLLCHRCNRMLPAWVSPTKLRALADYLERVAT